MARFDKFDAERRAQPDMNGHADSKHSSPSVVDSIEPVALPARKKVKREAEEEDLSDTNVTPPSKKHKQESEDDDLSDVKDLAPPKKKKKMDQDSDAAFAARLQAQENSRVRSTRGGGSKPTSAKKKRTPKKKTSAKVKAEDDSDLEGSGSDVKEKKVNRNSGFHVRIISVLACSLLTHLQKELNLSPSLSALLDGETKVSHITCMRYRYNPY